MSHGSLTSYQDGSLGASISLLKQYNEGSLGCACGAGGLGEYFESAVSGLGDMLDTTPKKIGAGLVAAAALYLVGKKMKLIPNRRRKSRRSKRSRRNRR